MKGDAQVIPVDTWLLFADAQGDAKPEEFPDLLPPNQAGYTKWAAALRPILATFGFLENEPDEFIPETGFVSLFNGRDLTGWGWHTNKVVFDGRTNSTDGRYLAKNGRIIVKTPPEGSRVEQMWTTREFGKDFVLKLEFRTGVNADSGIFIRLPQLQCRDYPLAGPYKQLRNYKPQDWNEMVVTVKGETAQSHGKTVSASMRAGSLRAQDDPRRLRPHVAIRGGSAGSTTSAIFSPRSKPSQTDESNQSC